MSTMNNSNGKMQSTGLKVKVMQGSHMNMTDLDHLEQEINDIVISTMKKQET